MPLSSWLCREGLKPLFPCRLTRLWKITCYSHRWLSAPDRCHSRWNVPLLFPRRCPPPGHQAGGRQAGCWQPLSPWVWAVPLRPAPWAASSPPSLSAHGVSSDSHVTAENTGRRRQSDPHRGAGPGSVPLDESLLLRASVSFRVQRGAKGPQESPGPTPSLLPAMVQMGRLRLGEETGFLPGGPGPRPCTWVCPPKCAHT